MEEQDERERVEGVEEKYQLVNCTANLDFTVSSDSIFLQDCTNLPTVSFQHGVV